MCDSYSASTLVYIHGKKLVLTGPLVILACHANEFRYNKQIQSCSRALSSTYPPLLEPTGSARSANIRQRNPPLSPYVALHWYLLIFLMLRVWACLRGQPAACHLLPFIVLASQPHCSRLVFLHCLSPWQCSALGHALIVTCRVPPGVALATLLGFNANGSGNQYSTQ